MKDKEQPREYAKDRMEYFREFHIVIAPVVVLHIEPELDDGEDGTD